MDADLKKLLTAWLGTDANIADSEFRALVDRLRSDEEFRCEFVAEISLLGQLRAVQTSEPRWLELEDVIGTENVLVATEEDFQCRIMDGVSNEQRVARTSLNRFTSGTFWVSLATVSLVVLATCYWVIRQNNSSQQEHTKNSEQREHTKDLQQPMSLDESPETVAVLSQSVNTKWHGMERPSIGDRLSVGELRLLEGTIQIEFLSGVRLLLRGPAHIELRAVDEIMLYEGAASCFITEMGRGFRILTKVMEVIDVGTAFSIEVGDDRSSEVHVLEGSVEINVPETEMLALQENQAIRMTDTGPRRVEFEPERFPQPTELRQEQVESAENHYKSWLELARMLSSDPTVMLHYTFEDSDPGSLEVRNSATVGRNATDGVIIGCDWTAGRWPSKRALAYRNSGDRVLFQVPGAYDSLSMIAWVRIDGLTQQTTSILMTEAPGRRARFAPLGDRVVDEARIRRATSNVQTVRWELTQELGNSTFNIGYQTSGQARWTYDRSAARNPATDSDSWGQWSCLAVTADVKTGEIAHYLNGERIGSGILWNSSPLLLDFMELGNFGVTVDEVEQSSGRSQRRFYGAIDEVVISSRVFDESEIANIWLIGKP